MAVHANAPLIDLIGAFQYTVYMDASSKQKLIRIIDTAADDRQAWLQSSTGSSVICRPPVSTIRNSIGKFQSGEPTDRWFILPGLRGVGKTTILTQLYLGLKTDRSQKFFLSLERVKLLRVNMQDILEVLEELVGERLEKLQEPIYIFMDEVQYLEDWALGLKIIFDRAPKAFIVCTGSSAISLQSNPDVARRSLAIHVHPLDFTEYVAFKNHRDSRPAVTPAPSLKEGLQRYLLESKSYLEVFSGLQSFGEEVERYWRNLDYPANLNDYIHFGNLPFTFKAADESARWQAIDTLLDESLAKDIGRLTRYQDTVSTAFPTLLHLLAESDVISLYSLSKTTGFNKRTLMSMLQTLCDTEILNPIKPIGSAYRQANRPSKYLFTSPAMRLALAKRSGVAARPEEKMSGKLLEDAVGLYLKHLLPNRDLHYDSKAGGADFILFHSPVTSSAIVLEVGWRKKDARQARQTLQTVNGRYSLIVTNSELDIDTAAKAVFVPLKYFLLA